MKTIMISAACMLVVSAAVHGQTGLINTTLPVTAMMARANFASEYRHVYRSWSAMYRGVEAVDVSQLSDRSVLARWREGNTRYSAFFTPGGVWLRTVVSYEETGLPMPVRDRVRTAYPDLRISYVDEVRSPGRENVYRVQVQDDRQLIILVVTGDDMVKDREYVKLN
jgi:hypothetical protein